MNDEDTRILSQDVVTPYLKGNTYDRRRINATEMDLLRRSARISKLDRKTNEYIRGKNGRARYDIG
jgi:hypothetical protein